MTIHEIGVDDEQQLQIDAAFNELALTCGHSVIGRFTELHLTELDYADHPVMERMRAEDVRDSRNNKVFVKNPKLHHSRIVLAVMDITHPDIKASPKGRSSLDMLCDQYQTLDLEDAQIREVLDDNYNSITSDDPRFLPDLVRGMNAFSNAEIDRWGGVYQPTLIRKAKWMAGWLIAHEKNEPLE